METNRTICDKYKDYIIGKTENGRDCRTAYKFPNGYGASVIEGYFCQGLELAVLYFEGDKPRISISTPITSDVVVCIKDEEELTKLLDQIKELKGA